MASVQGRNLHAGVLYVRHRPEQTLLYRIVEEHYPAFRDLLTQQGRPLPTYVAREFDDFLKCRRLEHGFLRVRCDHCHREKLAWAAPYSREAVPYTRQVGAGDVRLACRC